MNPSLAAVLLWIPDDPLVPDAERRQGLSETSNDGNTPRVSSSGGDRCCKRTPHGRRRGRCAGITAAVGEAVIHR